MAAALAAIFGQIVCELIFVGGVIVWWLITVQFNLLDDFLGRPDLNRAHVTPEDEVDIEAATACAAVSAITDSHVDNAEPVTEGGAESLTGDGLCSATDGADATPSEADQNTAPYLDPLPGDAPSASGLSHQQAPPLGRGNLSGSSSMRRRAVSLGRMMSDGIGRSRRGISTATGPSSPQRTLYNAIKRSTPLKSRLNVKKHIEGRVKNYGLRWLPDVVQSIGIEAAAGALCTTMPSGMRDAGVRAVDRAEALMRRWASFAGGTLILFRIFLWH